MIKDFNKYVVLTSQNTEAFLNYRYEAGDPSIYFSVYTQSIIPNGVLYINGLDINSYHSDASKNYDIYISNTGDPSIASFHIYTRSLDDFEYNVRISYISGHDDVSVSNRQTIISSNQANVYETSNLQLDDETSYLLLRTNPKFTGNIKLVLDCSDNLYLDTFKVSDVLNNKKYRKQQVSANSILSGDIRNVFSSLPLGELYKVSSEDTLNISIPKTELYKQYNFEYSYGARLLEDELYDDDYSILAPLWINSQLPDYFVVFRLDGVYNAETYESNDSSALNNLANKYLSNGVLIKSWNLKNNTPVGNYLRKHLNELLEIRSPLFLSLSDPNQKDPDPNSWYGISVDKGIITGRSETPYFFDQTNNFTDTNAFLSEGYERQNLLCPNLLNLEFIFSDNDVSLYSMHRYFGLYLTENELYQFSYYAENTDSSINILSLDGKDISNFMNSNIFNSSTGYINDNYNNRIFVLNDNKKLQRITNINNVNTNNISYINEYVNKPGVQLFSTNAIKKSFKKFITINLKNKLSQGEHLRIIDKTQFKIWEIYGISNNIIKKGESWTYASVNKKSDEYPTIYRTCFSVDGSHKDQIKAIKKAFDVFNNYKNTPFKTTIIKESNSQLSIELTDNLNDDFWFQRITSQTISEFNNFSTNFNTSANYDDIILYGVLYPSIKDFERISYDSSYGPIDFELFADRMSLMVKIPNFDNCILYSFDSSCCSLFDTYTMYMSKDNRYRIISNIDISTTINHTFKYILDPNELDNNSLIQTSNDILLVANKWNAYKTSPLNISLMGINPVKDIDFTVYDLSLGYISDYWYNRNDDLSTNYLVIDSSTQISIRNSYEIINGSGIININNLIQTYDVSLNYSVFNFNTFEGSALITPTTQTTLAYCNLDGSKNFISYKNKSEENILNYYSDTSTYSLLKYGLTIPYVSKWVGLGSDCRNNQLRLMLDSSMLDSSTNFIPYDNNFNDEISFPVFKYLSAGDKAWESYIFYDINDVLQYNLDGSIYNTTFKQLLLSNPYLDVFSKLVYSNNNVNSIKNRSSVLYYNEYKQSIDTIINGLNLSIFIDDNAKNTLNIKDWDRFKISFISTSSKNKDNNYPIEVFINENTKTFLIVWYQGSDNLNYNKRYSSYIGGKNNLYQNLYVDKQFQGFKTNDKYWSYIKTPFIVNHNSISTDINNLFDLKSDYDSSICSPFNQLNWNFWDNLHSIFNAYNQNYVASYSFKFTDGQYNTFGQEINYNYFQDSATYGNGVVNYSSTYMNNDNIYKNNTCSLSLLKYILSLNNVKYYIQRDNDTFTNDSFAVQPIYITLNDPRNYKGVYTYNGWYKPNFINILNFSYNEDYNIINTLNKDFILSNTCLNSYNNIKQLWYNKIVSQMSEEDVSIKNAIGVIKDFNIFKSQWDANYYIKDGGTLTNGFNSSLEQPSFFGSKLIKLPYELILDTWDNGSAKILDTNKDFITLQFNLTRKIINLFKDNPIFTANWAELTTADNIVNDYIKKTILGYYNISASKIKVYTYNKSYDGLRIALSYDNTFNVLNTNINGSLEFINNEYMYNINVPTLPDLSWYVKIALFEI